MKKEIVEMLLERFVNKVEEHPELNHFMPLTYNGIEYNAATSAHRYVLIPVNGCYQVPKPTAHIVDLLKVVPKFDMTIMIDIDLIKERVLSIPLEDEVLYEDCNVCDGEGEIYVGDGDYEDCHECNGEGVINKGLTGKKIPALKTIFTIRGVSISNAILHDIIFAFDTSGAKYIFLRREAEDQVNVVEFDNGVIVGYMPCLNIDSKVIPIF